MLTLEKLWDYYKRNDDFAGRIDDKSYCGVHKRVDGSFQVIKLNNNDVEIYYKHLPRNTTEENLKLVIAEMLSA